MRTPSLLVASVSSLLLGGCSLSSSQLLDLTTSIKDYLEPDLTDLSADRQASLGLEKSGWYQAGEKLQELGAGRWLNQADQAVMEIVCGHVRRWERPGPNLDSLSPLQGDPFLLPDPNQLVSAQIWFWVVSVSGDGPRVAQSRYQKTKMGDGSYRIEELWEIRDLSYAVKNEYMFDTVGSPVQVKQSVHPQLPVIELSKTVGTGCER